MGIWLVSLGVMLAGMVGAYVAGYSGKLLNWLYVAGVLFLYFSLKAKRLDIPVDWKEVISAGLYTWLLVVFASAVLWFFTGSAYYAGAGFSLAGILFFLICVRIIRRHIAAAV